MKYLLLCLFFLLHCQTTNPNLKIKTPLPEDFDLARKSFQTFLIKKTIAPTAKSYYEDPIPREVKEITYLSESRNLKSWIRYPVSYGEAKLPAIVFANSGFFRKRSDWIAMQAFIDQGFVVMYPSARGEDGNPGNFEFLYGEVDDFIAAGNHLKTLNRIDSNRIYLFGTLFGGAIALLTSMKQSPFQKIFTYNAYPETKRWDWLQPFDTSDPREIQLRSPMAYIQSIKKPIYMYVGDEFKLKSENIVFAKRAQNLQLPVTVTVLPSDTHTPFLSSITKIISILQEDEARIEKPNANWI